MGAGGLPGYRSATSKRCPTPFVGDLAFFYLLETALLRLLDLVLGTRSLAGRLRAEVGGVREVRAWRLRNFVMQEAA